MSGRAVARVGMAMAAALMLGAPARGNEAAHKLAEKFAGSTDGAHKAKPGDAKQQDQDKDAERKAAQAKQRAAHKAQAARKAAEARRKAAEGASRVAEERRAEEADMLARARREADEMRVADELERLTVEARRLVEEAEKERARAEALLASEAQDKRAAATEEEGLARQRTEETRRLVEKLNRVRQIREARLAAQARRQAEAPASAVAPPDPPVDVSRAKKTEPRVASGVSPPTPAPATAGFPPAAEAALPPAVASTPADRLGPRVAAAEMDSKTAAEMPAAQLPAKPTTTAPARLSETQVTVLIILEPGGYGIRRRGPRVADPILCMPDGCYVSTGADQPAVFMPGRGALRFGNTLGARAGACRGSLGCVFRHIELGSLPGYLQPVDLHILRHDRREVHTVLTDSGCRAELGHLVCTHGVQAQDYTMWVLPESLAKAAGPAALERALADGLTGRRSAELAPR